MKNTLRFAILIVFIWIWFPTFVDPTDIFTIPFIVNMIGLKMYIILSIIFAYLIYNKIEGRTIKDKLRNVRMEMKTLIK